MGFVLFVLGVVSVLLSLIPALQQYALSWMLAKLAYLAPSIILFIVLRIIGWFLVGPDFRLRFPVGSILRHGVSWFTNVHS